MTLRMFFFRQSYTNFDNAVQLLSYWTTEADQQLDVISSSHEVIILLPPFKTFSTKNIAAVSAEGIKTIAFPGC